MSGHRLQRRWRSINALLATADDRGALVFYEALKAKYAMAIKASILRGES